MTNITKAIEGYIIEYPVAIEFADTQNDHFWTHKEIELDKDIQDILVNLTEAEKHGVITVLKLFTQYELSVGNEYWGGVVKQMFPRPCISRMADCFSFFETNVHAPFYNKINEKLHLNTKEFYTSYKEDPVLSSRMEFIDESLNSEDKLLSIGTFAMVEGAVLYSNFAFLKHFQAKGKNKLKNLVAGINFSVRDENLHHEGGAWLFRQYKHEMRLSPEQEEALYEAIVDNAQKIREHEHRIVDMIFEGGRIEGITAHQMKVFVDSRINLCLENLGYSPIFEVKDNPIAEWFYVAIKSRAVINDFFNAIGNQYHRDWSESKLGW